MSLPAYVREQGGVVYLSIKVQPRASKNEVGEALGSELKLKVTAPPVDSAANEAVIKLLAEKLDAARSGVQLVRGGTSRHKTIAIHGIDSAEVVRRLVGTA